MNREGRKMLVRYIAQMDDLSECLFQLGVEWQHYLNHLEDRLATAYQVDVTTHTEPGRPRFDVTQAQLEYLRSLSFSWTEISSLLGVSRMTIFRRRREFGMLDDPETTLDDNQLRTVLAHVRREHPYLGERMVIGHLRGMGYKVSREKVREAIRATDPINTALRWGGRLTARRPYSVPAPNSLWHIGKLAVYPESPIGCVLAVLFSCKCCGVCHGSNCKFLDI